MTFRDALDALCNHIKPLIESDSQFSSYGGATAFLFTEHYTEEEQAGRPHVVLSGTTERVPEWGRFAYRASVSAPCKASRSAGAMMGVANPDPAHVRLSRKVEEILTGDYSELEALGLMDAEVKVGSESFNTTTDVAAIAVTISFVFFAREDY